METKGLPIQFQIRGIKTDEFAIIEEAFDEKNAKIHYSLETGFGVPESGIIICSIGFKFIQNNIPFVKVRANCVFGIKEESWENAIDAEKKNIMFPSYITDHLVVLTLGTLRGILHAKTEGTKFNKFFIPTINITELRNEDKSFSFSLAEIEKKKIVEN